MSPFSSCIEGQGLYIGGGWADFNAPFPTTQSFAIDLSVSWNASNPKFISLPDGPAYENGASARSADGKQWMACGDHICQVTNPETGAWSQLFTVPETNGYIDRVSAATDPETGLVYIPNGSYHSLMKVNLAARAFELVALHPTLMNTKAYSVAWSVPLRKMLLFGGTTGAIGQTDRFNAYSYSSAEGWRDLTTTMKGQIPTPRMEACLAPAYGGTKLVLFGGFTMDRVAQRPDIYVLDVPTMTWTKGPDAATKDQRGKFACGVSYDYFISWGGLSGPITNNGITGSTIVYNINTNNWTPTYTAAFALPPTGNVTTLPTPSGNATSLLPIPSGNIATSSPSATSTVSIDLRHPSENSSSNSSNSVGNLLKIFNFVAAVL
ncbi:hypothetical protein BGZ65_007033, partial [Modicella reniformis]